MEKDKYTGEEKYIIEENPEISLGIPYFDKITVFFPAFGNKNYVLYFLGQLISLTGSWLQTVAQGWLVLQLTNSVLLLGVVAALSSIPSLFFSLAGGVIIDRFPKKKIVIFTQFSSMMLAFIFGVLVIFNIVNIWEIFILSFLTGVVNALDYPARQAFIPEMVNKEQLPSAIALNSSTFNSARIIGPAMAGILIALVGTGGAFILNGASYIAVIIALLLMKVRDFVPKRHLHPVKAIKEGIHYSFHHPVIRPLLVFVGVVSIFGWSYATVMPAIAKNTFHLDASGLSYLYVANGIGALIATFLVSFFSKKVSPSVFILAGNTVFAIGIVLFTLTSNFHLALFFLGLSGLGLLSQFSMMNTTVQNMVEDQLRGRVMSIYALMFIGLSPIGNFEVGWVSDRFGTSIAIQVGAVIVFFFGLIVLLNLNKINRNYDIYLKKMGLVNKA